MYVSVPNEVFVPYIATTTQPFPPAPPQPTQALHHPLASPVPHAHQTQPIASQVHVQFIMFIAARINHPLPQLHHPPQPRPPNQGLPHPPQLHPTAATLYCQLAE